MLLIDITKKPVTLRRIYVKVNLLLSLSVVNIKLYVHYDSNTIGLFTVANLS